MTRAITMSEIYDAVRRALIENKRCTRGEIVDHMIALLPYIEDGTIETLIALAREPRT
jgi:hypothetical protein